MGWLLGLWPILVLLGMGAASAIDRANRSGRSAVANPAVGRTARSAFMGVLAIGLLAVTVSNAAELISNPAFRSFPGAALSYWGSTALPFAALGVVIGIGSFDRWEWTESGIRWKGLFRSREFAWDDLEGYGMFGGVVGFNFHFVRARSGQRIWWSPTALDHKRIDLAVRTARPFLNGLQRKPGAPDTFGFQ